MYMTSMGNSLYSKTHLSIALVYWTTPSGNQLTIIRWRISTWSKTKLTEQSLFQHSQLSQSHGIRCVQLQDSNHHGSNLHDQSQPLKEFNWCQRTSSRSKWVGSAKHSTTSLNSVKSLPNHPDDRARGHVLDQTGEKGLSLEISVI